MPANCDAVFRAEGSCVKPTDCFLSLLAGLQRPWRMPLEELEKYKKLDDAQRHTLPSRIFSREAPYWATSFVLRSTIPFKRSSIRNLRPLSVACYCSVVLARSNGMTVLVVGMVLSTDLSDQAVS
ncbi:hypothetical protein F4808DRAFT_259592 [Astrocystis sublimbata]|nr:hypothetical protein F4808DRAFT_259592 [Astrocystis sublimbata]